MPPSCSSAFAAITLPISGAGRKFYKDDPLAREPETQDASAAQEQEIDLFFEVGIEYMREHIGAGGDPDVAEDHIFGKGFPLGAWVAEMRRRHAAGELSADQAAQIEQLAGWR